MNVRCSSLDTEEALQIALGGRLKSCALSQVDLSSPLKCYLSGIFKVRPDDLVVNIAEESGKFAKNIVRLYKPDVTWFDKLCYLNISVWFI